MLIRDVIRNREPYSMKSSASVQDAAEFMASRNIGAVCVVDESGKLLGVFSERDVVNRVILQKRDPVALQVGEVTSELRAVIRCDETPHQALERMEGKRQERFADVVAWKFFPFEHQDLVPMLREDRGGRCARWASANNNCFVFGHSA